MAVQRIEEYGDVLKVILKPTKKFPVGYFYTDNNSIARQLIESYSWGLSKTGFNTYIVATVGTRNTGQKTLRFHQEYAKRVLGYYPDYIDHINGVEIDNQDSNLNIVNSYQNNRNKPTIGYHFNDLHNLFQPYYKLNKSLYFRGCYKTEPEALLATYNLREKLYSDYNYNFFLDRRGDKDILNLELTKQITSDYATYLHVKRYVESNPWYVYRYNLFNYCKEHNIIIPYFNLDNQGFMIHPVTKQRLCPY